MKEIRPVGVSVNVVGVRAKFLGCRWESGSWPSDPMLVQDREQSSVLTNQYLGKETNAERGAGDPFLT